MTWKVVGDLDILERSYRQGKTEDLALVIAYKDKKVIVFLDWAGDTKTLFENASRESLQRNLENSLRISKINNKSKQKLAAAVANIVNNGAPDSVQEFLESWKKYNKMYSTQMALGLLGGPSATVPEAYLQNPIKAQAYEIAFKLTHQLIVGSILKTILELIKRKDNLQEKDLLEGILKVGSWSILGIPIIPTASGRTGQVYGNFEEAFREYEAWLRSAKIPLSMGEKSIDVNVSLLTYLSNSEGTYLAIVSKADLDPNLAKEIAMNLKELKYFNRPIENVLLRGGATVRENLDPSNPYNIYGVLESIIKYVNEQKPYHITIVVPISLLGGGKTVTTKSVVEALKQYK